MLLSHIGKYSSESSEYESLLFAVNSLKNLRIDSEYFHLDHPLTSPYEYIANAMRMLDFILSYVKLPHIKYK